MCEEGILLCANWTHEAAECSLALPIVFSQVCEYCYNVFVPFENELIVCLIEPDVIYVLGWVHNPLIVI